MSSNSSKEIVEAVVAPVATKPKRKKPTWRQVLICVGLPIWVFVGFMLAQAIVLVTIQILQLAGVPLGQIDASLFQVVAGGIVYALSLAIVIGVPWLIKKNRTTKTELGIQRLPRFTDFLWVPAGAVVYMLLTFVLTALGMAFLTFVDFNQAQDTGFAGIDVQYEYILAFIMLVLIAPIAEELLFRGYLFGKLRKYAPVWVSILITSVLFALVHGAWNVGLDVFALSIVLCLLRVITGSLWPSIMLHMLKNGIAFYFLFINPTVLSTLGG